MSVNTTAQTRILRTYFEQFLDLHKDTFYQTDALKHILEAFDFAAEAHKNMLRFSGEPFISHPIEVAKIVAEKIGLGTKSVIAALLHDVLEKTETDTELLKKRFEPRVVKILEGLQRIKKSEFFENNTQASVFRQILLSMSDDIRVILIKIADKLHNLRTAVYLSEQMRKKAVSDILNIYAPLAHRLGLYEIKTEMEDLCLMYSNVAVYNSIREKLDESERDREQFISDFLNPIRSVLEKHLFEYRIESRTKSIYSIWKKMQAQHVPFEQVYDIFAVRIIFKPENVADESAEAQLIGDQICSIYEEKKDRTRNWLTNTKDTGYKALHITVKSKQGKWVEVQIRSEAMHEIAEYGFAAHTKYKGIEEKKSEFDRKVRDVLHLLHEDKLTATDFLDNLKINLFTSEIFVFTPGGEPISLPKSATALDLAFKIHTELALRSIAAKVNGAAVGLDTVLKSGDVVEIIAAKHQNPKKEWMKFVISQKALSTLRRIFREERLRFIAEGKAKINFIFSTERIDNQKHAVSVLKQKLHLRNDNDFYADLGEGKIDKTHITDILKHYCTETKARFWSLKSFGRKSQHNSTLINEKFEIAECCTPTPSDNIKGLLMQGDTKIHVHRKSCTVLEMLESFGHESVEVQWVSYSSISELTRLSISGKDRIGILSKIVNVLSSDYEVNIRSLNLDTDKDRFRVEAVLLIKDEEQIDVLQAKLSSLKDVEDVEIGYS